MLVELSEYQTEVVDVGPPSTDDLRIAEQLSDEFVTKLEMRWLHNGKLEVRSHSWVGVVALQNATIHIRPKLAGDELNVVRMIEYASGLDRLRTSQLQRTIDASAVGLLDLLCQLLAAQAEEIVRDGLMYDYTTDEDSLPALRGSLRYREQATRRFGQLDVLECRFDEFHADVFDNQFLLAGVAAGARLCQSPKTRKRLRRIEQNLSMMTSKGPHDSSYYLDRRNYTRRNERYRSAHELCLILIDRTGVDDIYNSGSTKSFSFLLNMNDIFEAFVATMVDEAFAATEWRVTTGRKHRSVIKRLDTNKTYSNINPDIVMSDDRELVPFDCKYKLYENKKLSTSDIYQTFLYAYSLGDPDNPRAGIIYPSSKPGIQPRLGVSRVDGPGEAKISGIAIDLVNILNSRADRDRWDTTLAEMRCALQAVLESREAMEVFS